MIRAIEKLTAQPGVDLAMLVTEDGVPIAFSGERVIDTEALGTKTSGMGREDALAALATSWLNELKHATAPLSWDQPARVVMRCARGSLVMQRVRGAVLLVMLARGVAPEGIRLPMQGTVARIERSLRGTSKEAPVSERATHTEPPGPIPSEKTVSPAEGTAETRSNTTSREGLSGT